MEEVIEEYGGVIFTLVSGRIILGALGRILQIVTGGV